MNALRLLKQELQEMGMFAPEYKQKIPKYIRRLGSCDCTDRGGSQRHHQYCEAEESFCADHPVSGTGTGRRCC